MCLVFHAGQQKIYEAISHFNLFINWNGSQEGWANLTQCQMESWWALNQGSCQCIPHPSTCRATLLMLTYPATCWKRLDKLFTCHRIHTSPLYGGSWRPNFASPCHSRYFRDYPESQTQMVLPGCPVSCRTAIGKG